MINELLMMAICAPVVSVLLLLRSFIVRADIKPHSYEVWIMSPGDDDPGNDPRALDDWPSEIEVPAVLTENDLSVIHPCDINELIAAVGAPAMSFRSRLTWQKATWARSADVAKAISQATYVALTWEKQ